MRTLLFCTSFSPSVEFWKVRYRRWYDAVKATSLEFDKALIIDDGSPVLPIWEDCSIINHYDVPLLRDEDLYPLSIYHFPDNLGRQGIYIYPGWFRSFMFAVKYARQYGYDKIIHLESDAFLASRRLCNHFNYPTNDWTVLWCPRYNIPETAIQIIGGKALDKYYNLSLCPYSEFEGKAADSETDAWIPFDLIEKKFNGDRYGEYMSSVPKNADYACQIGPTTKCWWIKGDMI